MALEATKALKGPQPSEKHTQVHLRKDSQAQFESALREKHQNSYLVLMCLGFQ